MLRAGESFRKSCPNKTNTEISFSAPSPSNAHNAQRKATENAETLKGKILCPFALEIRAHCWNRIAL